MKTKKLQLIGLLLLTAGAAFLGVATPVQAADPAKKPNILVIWGDDIGMWNVGAYTHGMMGKTPHIDSLAKNGAIFTDHYGQASCTAGRRRSLHRGAPEKPDGLSAAPESGHAQHQEGARECHGEDANPQRQQQLMPRW